jgi:hypothetical protein
MRALRLLVIVLGVLLVGGTLALVAAIIIRSSQPSQPRGAPRVLSAPAASPYDAVLDLPPGAVIQSLQPAGERLLVALILPDGRQQIVVLDLVSGARRGTIELRPVP